MGDPRERENWSAIGNERKSGGMLARVSASREGRLRFEGEPPSYCSG